MRERGPKGEAQDVRSNPIGCAIFLDLSYFRFSMADISTIVILGIALLHSNLIMYTIFYNFLVACFLSPEKMVSAT